MDKKRLTVIIAVVIVIIGAIVSAVVMFVNDKEDTNAQNESVENNNENVNEDKWKINDIDKNSEEKKNELFSRLGYINNMVLYKIDEDKVVSMVKKDNSEANEIIKEFSLIEAKETDMLDADDIKKPIYGLVVGDSDGKKIEMMWIDGLLMIDGNTYDFSYDFNKLTTDYKWKDEEESFINAFPYARELACDIQGTWNTEFLQKVQEAETNSGVTMSIIKHDNKNIDVEITNNGNETFSFSPMFSLDVKIDESWYEAIPTVNISFPALSVDLDPNSTINESYDIESYGELPSGTYRIVITDGVYAEFEIN